jgi:hypothetical protein
MEAGKVEGDGIAIIIAYVDGSIKVAKGIGKGM